MASDMYSRINVAQSLNPAARIATANGTGVDLAGYEGALCVVSVGTRTDGTHALKLQESDDNTTFTDVAAADLRGSFPADVTTGTPIRVGYKGTKRYVRAVATVTGATTGAVYGVDIVRDGARKQPVA